MPTPEFGGVSPEENAEERGCCVFALDTSGSMGADLPNGRPIDQLNAGIREFVREIRELDSVRHRLEVVIVEFNSSVQTVLEPTLGINLGEIPDLRARGTTKLVDGALEAIRIAKQRRQSYVDAGLASRRSWVIMITDGGPDPDQDVASLQREIEASEQRLASVRDDVEGFIFLPIGVESADMEFLEKIAMRNSELRPRLMSSTKFSEFFRWVTELFAKAAATPPGEKFYAPTDDRWKQGIDL
jgi:uncharacterized protein YegL